jgi:hypothetical protein
MTQPFSGFPVVPPPSADILPVQNFMGDWSRSRGISRILQGRRVLREALLRLIFLTVVLAAPSVALADPVPMCGELAQSIEAPPPIYPGREDALGQAHCARQGSKTFWEEQASLPPQADDTRTLDDKSGYLSHQALPRAGHVRVPVPRADGSEPPAGVRRPLDRPPRSALAPLR